MVRPLSLDFAKAVVRAMFEHDVKYPAISVAYSAFVSFIPLLMLLFIALGRQVAFEVYAGSAQFVTPETQQLIFEALTTASGRTGAFVLSVVAIAWGAKNVAVGFLTVVERVENRPDQPLGVQLRNAVIVLATLSVAILAIFFQSVILAVTSPGLFGTLVGFLGLLAVLTVTFLPLYYLPSTVVTEPAAALPGALTAAAGWTIIHAVVQFYTNNAAQYAIYGVASGIVIILTTTYLAAAVLMVGVIVNVLLATAPDGLSVESVESVDTP
jgi:membrane protein